jgi:hypothetical protein
MLPYVQIKNEQLNKELSELESIKRNNITLSKAKEIQNKIEKCKNELEKMEECEIQLQKIERLCDFQKDTLYKQLFDVNYSDRLQNIQEKLKQARHEIDKAADIALDKEAYIYWNLGLITLVQSKIEGSINKYEVCNAWKKALELGKNNQNNQRCIPIYQDAIQAVEKQNDESKAALSASINNSTHKQGWLKVMSKDVEIILKFLDEKDELINDLISRSASMRARLIPFPYEDA